MPVHETDHEHRAPDKPLAGLVPLATPAPGPRPDQPLPPMRPHHPSTSIYITNPGCRSSVKVVDFLPLPTVVPLTPPPARWGRFWGFTDDRNGVPIMARRQFDDISAAMLYLATADDVVAPVPASTRRFVPHGGLKFVSLIDAQPCTAAVVSRAADRRALTVEFRRLAVETARRLRSLVPDATAPTRLI